MSDDAPSFEIQLEDGVARLPQDEWDALVADGSAFLEWAFLASLEDAKTVGGESGWVSKPLIARENGRIIAACPLYLKTHSDGEFVFDFSWADAAQRAGIDYYPKLLVGVPFSPVTGARFLVHPSADRKAWIERLAGALREICDNNNLSSVHINFCLPDEAEVLQRLGFHTRIGLQYHWQNHSYGNFEDYLAAFRSKRRNQVRREKREMEKQDVTIETIAGDDITSDLVDPMYQFYLSTIRSRAWGREYLNRAVFELLIERFRDRLVFVIAKQREERIAGTFNVQKGDALFGRYWGAIRSVRHLHFNVCYYASVEYCIDRGLARFEPGAGGEYKQMRGFDACPTYSAHYVADPRLSAAIEHFLEDERSQARRAIDSIREHSALINRTPDKPKD